MTSKQREDEVMEEPLGSVRRINSSGERRVGDGLRVGERLPLRAVKAGSGHFIQPPREGDKGGGSLYIATVSVGVETGSKWRQSGR